MTPPRERDQAAAAGREEVRQPDPAEEVLADPVGDRVDDLGAVVGGVDVHAERAAALRQVDDARRSRRATSLRVGVGGRQLGQLPRDLVHQAGVPVS